MPISPAEPESHAAETAAVPFSERTPTSAGQFTSVSPQSSGLSFRNTWRNSPKYASLVDGPFAGGGVTLGDYDLDGLVDVFLTHPEGGSRLFRNLGEFSFEDVTKRVGLQEEKAWGAGAAFADVDGDADLDLYVCGYDCPNRLYINDGQGRFTEGARERGVAFHGASVMPAFADYDNDGDLDLFVATNRFTPPDEQGSTAWAPTPDDAYRQIEATPAGPTLPDALREYYGVIHLADQQKVRIVPAGQRAKLYRNNGHGVFDEVSHDAGVDDYGMSLSAVWWDYDADGFADLYIANDFYTQDRFYRNRGDGTFEDVTEKALPHIPWFSMGCNFEDLNNDGWLDFMATDMSGTTHYTQKLSMGDMDSDGWFLDAARPRQYMRNAVFVNAGVGRFWEAAHMMGLANSDWTWAVKFGDFDCDGLSDLYITNGMTGDWTNSDLRRRYGQGWERLKDVIEPKRDRNLAYRNRGELQFDNVGSNWGLAHESVSFGAALGDLDRDGDLDIVVNNFNDLATVYRNDVSSGHRITFKLKGTRSNTWGVGSTIRLQTASGQQIRYLSLARGYMATDEPMAHFGLGDETEVTKVTVQWPSGIEQVLSHVVVDAENVVVESSAGSATPDQTAPSPTLFAASSQQGVAVHRETPFDDFAAQPLLPNKLSQRGPGIAVGDVDGDGDDDMYVSGAAGAPGQLRLNNSGRFTASTHNTSFRNSASAEELGVLLFDADQDGDLDLFVACGGVEHPQGAAELADRLYLNDGAGEFALAGDDVLPHALEPSSCVAAADFDRDGDLDLFVGAYAIAGQYPLAGRSRLLRNDSQSDQRRFTDVTELHPGVASAGLVNGALWSDVDQDGWQDLLLAVEWGPIRVFMNNRGVLHERTAEAGIQELTGWWNGICSLDIDSDGDTDYCVTNYGLNTKYHPSAEHPSLLYYGDFSGDGNYQIVEAKDDGQRLLPVRGKSCSQNAMPFLESKFPTYHEFAIAELKEIYTDTRLDKALRLQATELRSGVFVNDGTGRMRFEPLAQLAQIAPGFGLTVSDFDADGYPDVFLAQNFFGPQRETGYMDGGMGLLLRGDGRGNLIPVAPAISGIVLPQDTKSSVITDVDRNGFPDLVVGCNNDYAKLLFNHNPEASKPYTVTLVDSRGHRLQAGARVRVQWSDGAHSMHELNAGSGYLSQSTSTLFLGNAKRVPTKIVVSWPLGGTTELDISEIDISSRSIVVRENPRN